MQATINNFSARLQDAPQASQGSVNPGELPPPPSQVSHLNTHATPPPPTYLRTEHVASASFWGSHRACGARTTLHTVNYSNTRTSQSRKLHGRRNCQRDTRTHQQTPTIARDLGPDLGASNDGVPRSRKEPLPQPHTRKNETRGDCALHSMHPRVHTNRICIWPSTQNICGQTSCRKWSSTRKR